MNSDDSLQASFWLMVALQTIGSVDMPGSGDRKMPAPRSYLAIIIAWLVLQLGSDAGYGRATSAVGWVIVLAGMVTGPFGTKVTNLFSNVVNIVAPSNFSANTQGAALNQQFSQATGQPPLSSTFP